MGIRTNSEYIKFYLSLDMEKTVSLSSFVNNEKRVLKGKLENKNLNKERVLDGIEILNNLTKEINEMGEREVLKKYGE
jgi:hypothetical protein